MSNTRKPKPSRVQSTRSSTPNPMVRTLKPAPARVAAGMHRVAGDQHLARVSIQRHVQSRRGV